MTVVKKLFDLGESAIYLDKKVVTEELQATLLEYFKSVEWFGGDYSGRKISRLQRWYHMEGRRISDKWPEFSRWTPCAYTELIIAIQAVVTKFVAEKYGLSPSINSVLINYYRDGASIIPRHRDSEEIFGDNPTIIILSLGSKRVMRFSRVNPGGRSMKTVDDEEYDVVLEPGSVLVMAGTTQKYYCHELLHSDSSDARYSMTFRHHPDVTTG